MARICAALQLLAAFCLAAAEHNFSPHCEPYPGKRVVLLSMASEGVDFLVNWIHHAKPFLGDSEQVVVIPEDEDAVPMLEYLSDKTNPKIKNLPLEFSPGDDETAASYRPEAVRKLLEKGCTVLYVDTDTLFTKDVLTELDEPGFHDLVLTPCAEEGIKEKKPCEMSTSLMYYQPTGPVDKFLKEWAEAVKGEKRIKPAFNKLLRGITPKDEEQMEVTFVPFAKFPPGRVYKNYPLATIFQANFRRTNDDKREQLKAINLWRVAE